MRDLAAALDDTDLGRDQLVHSDLAGNVLLDASGAPFVIDFSPTWRSPLWRRRSACSMRCCGTARAGALGEWRTGAQRQAMLRAAIFRVLSDIPCDVRRYADLGLV